MTNKPITREELEELYKYIQIKEQSQTDNTNTKKSKKEYSTNMHYDKPKVEKVLKFRKQVEYGPKKRIKP